MVVISSAMTQNVFFGTLKSLLREYLLLVCTNSFIYIFTYIVMKEGLLPIFRSRAKISWQPIVARFAIIIPPCFQDSSEPACLIRGNRALWMPIIGSGIIYTDLANYWSILRTNGTTSTQSITLLSSKSAEMVSSPG